LSGWDLSTIEHFVKVKVYEVVQWTKWSDILHIFYRQSFANSLNGLCLFIVLILLRIPNFSV